MDLGKMNTGRTSSVFIETFGCQMNKNDSELIRGILLESGFVFSDDWESSDIILINTCSVRDHAERRVFGRIDALAGWKKKSPHRRIGVLGCMARRLGGELAALKPQIDWIVGPDGYRRLPEMLADPVHCPEIHAETRPDELYSGIPPVRESGVSGWVTISRGCGNFCSYCIVPYTRGAERCRPAADILREIEEMAGSGFREVTLLGQNVNSYADGETDFAALLERVSRIPELLRIRFMTSHPKDLSDRLLETMASESRICPHIHLPVQSGSSRILGMMNRGYTRERVLERVAKARERIRGVSITTDLMVGFPGETERDFQDTMDLVAGIRFQEAYTYAYSPRKGTAAADLPGSLPEDEKRRRLGALIGLQRGILIEIKRGLIGSTVEVLPEKPSSRSAEEWMGKTPGGHVVVFRKDGIRAGFPVRVLIESCSGATLRGSALPRPPIHVISQSAKQVDNTISN
jgi:tRNA-2-methylthio-N6-dimethylallyladenosine synthase